MKTREAQYLNNLMMSAVGSIARSLTFITKSQLPIYLKSRRGERNDSIDLSLKLKMTH